MFECKLEETITSIFIEQAIKDMLDHNGFSFDFRAGFNILTYDKAVALVNRMYNMLVNIPKYQHKRFYSVITQISNAFGPEFDARHNSVLCIQEEYTPGEDKLPKP